MGLIKIIQEENWNRDSRGLPQVIIASLPVFPQDKMIDLVLTRIFDQIIYLRLSLINPSEEEEVGQEEADAELQVEGGADVLDGLAQEESEGRQEETQQRQAQSHVGDHSQDGIRLEHQRKDLL